MDVESSFSVPEVLGLFGATLAGIATVVPWVTATVGTGSVRTIVLTTGIEGIGIPTLLLALLAAVAILTPGLGPERAVATALVGVAVAAVGIVGIIRISQAVSSTVVSPGVGLYLTVAGGLVLVVGGLLEYVSVSSSIESTSQ
jgi:hypothetical protein